MTFPIAILQGRLSQSPDERFQFFPYYWASEFLAAQVMGFEGIEWLCDAPEMEDNSNPVLLKQGSQLIRTAELRSAVRVASVCADWFMKYDLRSLSGARTLPWLTSAIHRAELTTNRVVLIPLLEAHAPKSLVERERVRENLQMILPMLANYQVSIAFETEMNASALQEFVDSFQNEYVGVYYDIGNCTSYGFDCASDIKRLAHRIKGVHVKDRKRYSTQSVPLGTGDANIRGCLESLGHIGWSGSLVLQAFRGAATYLKDAQQQLTYIQKIQKEVFGNG